MVEKTQNIENLNIKNYSYSQPKSKFTGGENNIRFKAVYIMVVMSISVILLIFSFHLCTLAFYNSYYDYVQIFGYINVNPVILSNLIFALGIIVEIVFTLLIKSQINEIKKKNTMYIMAISVIFLTWFFYFCTFQYIYLKQDDFLIGNIRIPIFFFADIAFASTIVIEIVLILIIISQLGGIQ